MAADETKWPVVYCNGQAVCFEPSSSFGATYFGGPLDKTFVGREFGPEPLHRVLTLSMDLLPQPEGLYLHGSIPLFYGMRYDECVIRYRVPVMTGTKIQFVEDEREMQLLELNPVESLPDWPYEGYPRLLPYIPLTESSRSLMTPEEFGGQFAWQGLSLLPTELAVVVPACPHLGMSMWGPAGDAEAVQLLFKYDFVTHEVVGSNQCT